MKKSTVLAIVLTAAAFVVCASYVLTMLFVNLDLLAIGDRVEQQQTRINNLVTRVDALEQGQKNVCRTLLQMSAIDDSLVALAGSSNTPLREDTLNRIYASQAYCRGGVVIYVDMRGISSYKVSFMGSVYANNYAYLLFDWREGEDPAITLLDSEDKEVVFFNALPFLRIGDFMKIWITAEKPQFSTFYDPGTGLAVLIQHLDGSWKSIK